MQKKLEKTYRSVGLLSIAVVLISLAGKVFGFLRELLLAKYFGTSSIVDVYLMSYTIPAILFGALPALGVGFTPIFFTIDKTKDRNSFLTKTILLSVITSLFCILITYLFDYEIVNFCARGFSDAAKQQTTRFLKITVWAILFNTPIQVLIAYLNCNKNYINSSLSGLTISITNALFITLAAHYGDILLPWGYLVPYVIQFIWLYIASLTIGHRPVIKKDNHQSSIKKLLILVVPICFSNILVDLNGFVDKTLSSYLQEGSLSSLNYAFTLRAVVVTVSQTLIATIYYPSLSELYAKGDQKDYRELVEKILSITTLIIIPINIIALLLPDEIIQIVLMRGNFNSNSVGLTKGPFLMYMLSLTCIIIRELFIRVMYISNESKGNLIYGAINVLINIGLSLLLVRRLQHIGLALATSIATIVTFPLYVRKARKLIPAMPFKTIMIKIFKIILSSLIMGGVIVIVKNVISIGVGDSITTKIVIMMVYLAIGCLAYSLMLHILKVEEMKQILGKILGKIRR